MDLSPGTSTAPDKDFTGETDSNFIFFGSLACDQAWKRMPGLAFRYQAPGPLVDAKANDSQRRQRATGNEGNTMPVRVDSWEIRTAHHIVGKKPAGAFVSWIEKKTRLPCKEMRDHVGPQDLGSVSHEIGNRCGCAVHCGGAAGSDSESSRTRSAAGVR